MNDLATLQSFIDTLPQDDPRRAALERVIADANVDEVSVFMSLLDQSLTQQRGDWVWGDMMLVGEIAISAEAVWSLADEERKL